VIKVCSTNEIQSIEEVGKLIRGTVTWNWGSGNPGGEVAEIKKHGELVIESKGKEVKKNASPDNPVFPHSKGWAN
jgi:hypothetical protein